MALKLSEVLQKATGKPVEEKKEAGLSNYTNQPRRTLTDEARSAVDTGELQRRADLKKAEVEQHIRAEESFRQAGTLTRESKAKILQGIAKGENIYSLFLTASKALAVATNDEYFYSQAEKSLLAVYGAGFLEPLALEVDIMQTQNRIELLNKALARDEVEAGDKQRITTAIAREQEKLGRLRSIKEEG